MPHELGGDEVGRFGTARQIGKHGSSLTLALLGVGLAEKHFRPRLVQVVAEIKAARHTSGQPALAAADRPARDDLREACDVGLVVAAVYAQGVQFENLARQIFVDAELALGLAGIVAVGTKRKTRRKARRR